jgi:hypothetical protein
VEQPVVESCTVVTPITKQKKDNQTDRSLFSYYSNDCLLCLPHWKVVSSGDTGLIKGELGRKRAYVEGV